MKHFILATLVAFGLLCVASLTYSSAAAQSEASKSSIPADVKLMQINGKVVSLDPQTQQLIVKSKKIESNFVLTAETVLKRGRNAVKPASLKAGTSVRVRYYEQDGQRIADRVIITSGKPRHAKEGNNE